MLHAYESLGTRLSEIPAEAAIIAIFLIVSPKLYSTGRLTCRSGCAKGQGFWDIAKQQEQAC